MSSFVVPKRVRVCGGCGGTGKTLAPFEAVLGPRLVDCEVCETTGVIVDWPKVEEEIERMVSGHE